MDAFKTLLYDKDDGIAHVILNRPGELNVYNIQMRDDLYEVLRCIKKDGEIRVVLFRGAGEKAFCAGADLSEFLSAPQPVIARQVRRERDVWAAFLSISQPMIAAIHGYALGSGIEIALCCDIRIASDDARFGVPEVGLGIIPAAGGTQTLPRVAGRGAALDMLFSNRWLSAEEAYNVHLINRVVQRGELFSAADEMAKKIASHNPNAVRYAKQAMIRGLDMTLDEGLALEKRLAHTLWGLGEERN